MEHDVCFNKLFMQAELERRSSWDGYEEVSQLGNSMLGKGELKAGIHTYGSIISIDDLMKERESMIEWR
jgi:hypothetical protein